MSEANAVAPIIIKRKKVVAAEGHHGGAWKVAYADFVTAMMAFFMLMWLLNATTEKQRKGIADYFNPTIPVNRISGGGEGVFGGQSVFSEDALPQNGTGGSDKAPTVERQARGNTGADPAASAQAEAEEKSKLKEVEAELSGNSGESSVADKLLEHILTRVTDEGLIVEIFDLPGERPCCMDHLEKRTRPTRDGFQAVRSKLGRPSSVIRLSMRTPIFASVF